MDTGTGCFDRFWMAALTVIAALAISASVALFSANRVTAQESDWSQFTNGYLYLINPVGEVKRYTIMETPRVVDGFLCTIVDQYEVETCVPLTNIAGIMAPQ